MLTLTENASTIVKNIAEQTPGVEEGGLRISSTDGAGNNFAVAVAPAAEPSDEIVESSGARVFLEPVVAVALADKVLDAQVDGEGAVRFTVGDLS
jgi:iron-sulfur cluster assembly protein